MIEASGLSYAFGDRTVVTDASISASEGRVVGLIGPNGSGKTTVLRMLYGSLRPRAGTVTVDGISLHDYNGPDLARRMAVVVQESLSELPVTVADMVLLGRTPHRAMFERFTGDDHRIAGEALERVGLAEMAGRQFAQLSGGERQRVLIARVLAQQAEHLLLDEPTNHLDVRYQHELMQLLASLDVTTVVVLHDLNLAARYCDEVVVMHHGHTVASGTPTAVMQPELLEPVYGIGIDRLDSDSGLHLLFGSPLVAAGAQT